MLVTGGGDCALKAWRLLEWLPVNSSHLLTQPISVSELEPHDTEQQGIKTQIQQHDLVPDPCAASQSSTTQLLLSLPSPSRNHSQHTGDSVGAEAGSPADVLNAPHDSTSEGVCALALSARDTLYVATSVGRIMHVDLLLAQKCAAERNADCSATCMSSVCVAPQQLMPLSCCAAARYCGSLNGFQGTTQPEPATLHPAEDSFNVFSAEQQREGPISVDVVVCGARAPGLTVACVGHDRDTPPRVLHAAHFQLSETTQASILAVWIPKALPPGHVLLTDSDNTVWWVFVALSPWSAGGAHADVDMVVLARCDCGAKTRVACVEVLPGCGLLVMGDSLGGVAVHSFPVELQTILTVQGAQCAVAKGTQCDGCRDDGEQRAAAPLRLKRVSAFRKVHASTPVTLAKAVGNSLYTGGRNGAILSVLFGRVSGSIEFGRHSISSTRAAVVCQVSGRLAQC